MTTSGRHSAGYFRAIVRAGENDLTDCRNFRWHVLELCAPEFSGRQSRLAQAAIRDLHVAYKDRCGIQPFPVTGECEHRDAAYLVRYADVLGPYGPLAASAVRDPADQVALAYQEMLGPVAATTALVAGAWHLFDARLAQLFADRIEAGVPPRTYRPVRVILASVHVPYRQRRVLRLAERWCGTPEALRDAGMLLLDVADRLSDEEELMFGQLLERELWRQFDRRTLTTVCREATRLGLDGNTIDLWAGIASMLQNLPVTDQVRAAVMLARAA